jgi:hypothetical protein
LTWIFQVIFIVWARFFYFFSRLFLSVRRFHFQFVADECECPGKRRAKAGLSGSALIASRTSWRLLVKFLLEHLGNAFLEFEGQYVHLSLDCEVHVESSLTRHRREGTSLSCTTSETEVMLR